MEQYHLKRDGAVDGGKPFAIVEIKEKSVPLYKSMLLFENPVATNNKLPSGVIKLRIINFSFDFKECHVIPNHLEA